MYFWSSDAAISFLSLFLAAHLSSFPFDTHAPSMARSWHETQTVSVTPWKGGGGGRGGEGLTYRSRRKFQFLTLDPPPPPSFFRQKRGLKGALTPSFYPGEVEEARSLALGALWCPPGQKGTPKTRTDGGPYFPSTGPSALAREGKQNGEKALNSPPSSSFCERETEPSSPRYGLWPLAKKVHSVGNRLKTREKYRG